MRVPRLDPGMHALTLEPGGRRYALLVPEPLPDGSPPPLVTALHYGGPVAPWTGKSLLLDLILPGLRELGALFVAPDRTRERWDDPASEAEVLELLGEVEAAYDVDRERTLLTGYSLGGIGTWFIAGRNPGRFAAALPISASPPQDAADREWPLPVYVVHGRRDELFPLERTEKAVSDMRERGARVELAVVEGATHFDVPGFAPALKAAVPWIRRAWISRPASE